MRGKHRLAAIVIALVCGGWLAPVPDAHALTAGPNYAGALGTNAWLNAGNAVGSLETTCAGSETTSNPVGFWNTYGFATPASATINGIVVEIKASWKSDPPAGHTINIGKDETTLGVAKSITTLAEQACGAAQTIHTFGGATDLWGLTAVTPADVNSANFTIRINNGTAQSLINLNWIRVTVYYTDTTTLGTGTDPANATIAPGAAATMVDSFTFVASAGTDSVTAATVTLAAGTSGGISLVEITNDAGTVVHGSVANPATDTPSITLTTPISVTTTATQYKVRVTPKSHVGMPAPPGSSYAVTALISAWTGTNAKAGSDTAGTTVTIDNLSPANVTGAGATAGDAQVTVSWTNPLTDFSNVVVLRNTATIADVPAEGSSPAVNTTIGASVVRYDLGGTGFTDTGLTNGTRYFFRIFAKDTSGNYAATGVEVSAPACPVGSNVTYVASTATPGAPGTVTLRWAPTASPVVILRKQGAFGAGDAPVNGVTYSAGPGPNGTTVVFSGTGGETTVTDTSGLTNATTYNYRVFARDATPCYATGAGTDVTGRPVASGGNEQWAYMSNNGSALSWPTTDDSGNVYVGSNAGRIISLSGASGIQNWTPATTTAAVQGYPVWTSLSAGGTPLVFGGDQSGRVYAVETAGGTTSAPGWQVTPTGSTAMQAGISIQIRAYSDAVNFPAAYPGTYDVVFAATSNASATNNKLVALRSDTGATLWTFPLVAQDVDQILGQPWIDYTRNQLYVTSKAGGGTQSSLWVLSSLTGSIITSFNTLGQISAAPTQSYNGNTLWVGNENGDIYAIDVAPATPTLKWAAPLALGATKKIKGFVWEDYSTAGRIYFTTDDGTVRCFQDPGAGATPSTSAICTGWSAVATTVAGATRVLLLDKIYVGSWDGTTGTIRYIDPTNGSLGATPYTVGDGTRQVGDMSTVTGSELLIGTTEGKIFKISLPLP